MCGQARAGNIRVLVVPPKKVEIVLVVTDHFVKSSQNIFIQCRPKYVQHNDYRMVSTEVKLRLV